MSVRDNQNVRTRGFDWLAIARIAILQIVVLLGLTYAAVRYVRWSSDVAWEAFSGISKPAALEAKTRARSPNSGQTIKHPGSCPRSV
jgi:hypothetical protein